MAFYRKHIVDILRINFHATTMRLGEKIIFQGTHNRKKVGNIKFWPNAFFLLLLSFLLVSCFAQRSYLGRTTLPNHILSLNDEGVERSWQTDELIINYTLNKPENDSSMTLSGRLSATDSLTRSFPTVKKLTLQIHYLDTSGKVIGSQPIGVNHGYKNKLAKNLTFRETLELPAGTESFTFSYFGIMAGLGTADENPGEWEIYFHPFRTPGEPEQPTRDLFYQE